MFVLIESEKSVVVSVDLKTKHIIRFDSIHHKLNDKQNTKFRIRKTSRSWKLLFYIFPFLCVYIYIYVGPTRVRIQGTIRYVRLCKRLELVGVLVLVLVLVGRIKQKNQSSTKTGTPNFLCAVNVSVPKRSKILQILNFEQHKFFLLCADNNNCATNKACVVSRIVLFPTTTCCLPPGTQKVVTILLGVCV